MPLSNYMRGNFLDDTPSILKSRIFHGINQAIDPNDKSVKTHCYADSAVNTWIDKGNITVRNNYAAVIGSITTDMADSYTYTIVSIGCYAPQSGTQYLVAGVQAKLAGVHHHYCIVHRVFSTSTYAWSEVKCAAVHGLGSAGDSIWFANANFDFNNYFGDFNETGTEINALMMSNGADPPAFYTPSGLGVIGSGGWYSVTADPATDQFTSAIPIVTNDDYVEVFSLTQQMPGGITAWVTHLVGNASGSTFQLVNSLGTPYNITSAGANVIFRIVVNYGTWLAATYSTTTNAFTCATLAALGDGTYVQGSAPSGSLPRGMNTGGYYIVERSGDTFKLALTSGGTALTFGSTGTNLKLRLVVSNPKDAPRGSNIFVHNNRVWITNGHTVYHNAGYYDNPNTEIFDGKAHPNDWTTALFSGKFPLQTFDGDIIRAATVLNGKPWIAKQNSVFTIYGDEPPYTINQVFTAKGTIAKNSLAWHISGGLFYVTPEGIQVFNGSTSELWIGPEINDLWNADNDDCICTVVGDTLYMYGYFNVGGSKVKRLLAVDILEKNINLWTLALGASTLTVDAVLPPNFTQLLSTVTEPEFWFASGDTIYKYSTTAPAAGAAVPMEYTEPAIDYGDAMRRKRVSRLAITGEGGTLTVTPIVDGTTGTASTVELPRKTPFSKSANGYRISFKYSSTDDPVIIKDIEREYT